MSCMYPNCRQPATFEPVIEIPTVRTKGVIMPEMRRDIINDAVRLSRFEMNRNMLIAQYEDMVRDAEERSRSVTVTDQPTYLIGQPICGVHKEDYKFSDWFSESDWRALQEAARSRGYFLDSQALITVAFKTVGWEPRKEYIEVVRG